MQSPANFVSHFCSNFFACDRQCRHLQLHLYLERFLLAARHDKIGAASHDTGRVGYVEGRVPSAMADADGSNGDFFHSDIYRLSDVSEVLREGVNLIRGKRLSIGDLLLRYRKVIIQQFILNYSRRSDVT